MVFSLPVEPAVEVVRLLMLSRHVNPTELVNRVVDHDVLVVRGCIILVHSSIVLTRVDPVGIVILFDHGLAYFSR